ncbi:aspartate carbamoyltransferase [Candidatus Woesearchaeota archaeon CG10_big_fil_rev_8_21_14_0_10_44_13]|nr:MAG: aspartate carbamoyltransferase [Candidatus Woesearchaeota archaeon CG10_big_fil_rev_8_21_14_0_10_44_13]
MHGKIPGKISSGLPSLSSRHLPSRPNYRNYKKTSKKTFRKNHHPDPAHQAHHPSYPNNVNFKGRSIISINDLTREEIIHVLETARKIEAMGEEKKRNLLAGHVLATLFFEPSTRTRMSFESSMKRLGGKTIGFVDPTTTSFAKGETLHDSIKMIENYVDVIAMRHPTEGAARVAAESTRKPVINGGDGANQHPTQTLLDLYTIKKTQGRLTGLNVAMVGDLKYGRTVHSLAIALSHFNCRLFFVAPESLKMPKTYLDMLAKKGIEFSEHEKIEEVIDNIDILYSTRIQKERFPDPTEYQKVKDIYILKRSMLGNVRENLKIMHPLPRVNEIHPDVDKTPYAYYFQQAANGIPVRQAVLSLVLGALK